MKIAFVLDRPELCGGVKIIFQDAQLLLKMGHEVTVFAVGSQPEWSPYDGPYVDLSQPFEKNAVDVVVATFWTTIAVSEKLGIGPIVHNCQGFEASYPHLVDQVPQIEAAYRKPYPCFTVSQYLADLLKSKFAKNCYVLPPPVDPLFKPVAKAILREPFRILISGIFECTWKGVEVALLAARKLRKAGIPICVVRISLLPQSHEERTILAADEYYYCIEPAEVASLTATADLCLFASHQSEGFGLPLIEAMRCGVPVVSSNIASAIEITQGELPLFDPLDENAFYCEAQRILKDRLLWQQRADIGLELTKPYTEQVIAKTLVSALEWATTQS